MEVVLGCDGGPVDVVERVCEVSPEQVQAGSLAVRSDRQHRYRRRHIGFAHTRQVSTHARSRSDTSRSPAGSAPIAPAVSCPGGMSVTGRTSTSRMWAPIVMTFIEQ